VSPNLLGFDVSGLDVERFLRHAHLAFLLVASLWLLLLLLVRRPGFLLLGVVAANAFAWLLTTYPLARPYALGTSADRLNNLAMCQVVASGNSPLETWLVGQTHFGPYLRPYVMLWTLLVATLSGFDPERVLWLYGLLPLVMSCGFALTLYFGLGPARGNFWSPWQRALIAGFATLLASAPTDFQGPYEVPWALTFLLKPNHALGLVLFPLVLRALANIDGWRARFGAGLLLHLLAWAFALHFVYMSVGLLVFVALSWLFRRHEFRRALVDTVVVVGLSAVVAAPYVLWLARAPRPIVAASAPAEITAVGAATPMLLEATLRNGLVFPAGLWGAWLAWRHGGRLGRLLAAQLSAALLIWVGYAGVATLGLTPGGPWRQIFEQPDEIFFWLRFLTAACAGIGAWDLAGRLQGVLFHDLVPAARASLVALVCLPSALPFWWHPPDTDRYFEQSRAPLPEELRRFGTFLLRETPTSAVLAGDPWLARWAAALAGRRSLVSMGAPPPLDLELREELLRALVSGADPAALRLAASRYGVSHLVVTPKLLSVLELPDLEPDSLESHPELTRVFACEGPDYGFIRVYRLAVSGPTEASASFPREHDQVPPEAARDSLEGPSNPLRRCRQQGKRMAEVDVAGVDAKLGEAREQLPASAAGQDLHQGHGVGAR